MFLVTKNLAELCTLVIDDVYGELPSRIFAAMLNRGRAGLAQLAQYTSLTPRQLRHGLAVLLQYDLLYFFVSPDGSTVYDANPQAAYNLLRAGKVLEMVERLHGARARDVMQSMLALGHTRIADLKEAYRSKIDKWQSSRKANGHGTNTNGAGTNANGDNDYDKQAPEIQSLEQLNSVLCTLVAAEVLEVVNAASFKCFADREAEARDKIRTTYFHDGVRGNKKKEEFETRVSDELYNQREEPRKLKRTLQTNGGAGSSMQKRRKLVAGGFTNGLADDDRCPPLDPTTVLRVNHDKCAVELRNYRLVQAASAAIGETTAQVYAALLRQVTETIPRCRADPLIDVGGGDFYRQRAVATSDVFDSLDPNLDVFTGIGKAAPNEIDLFAAERLERHAKVGALVVGGGGGGGGGDAGDEVDDLDMDDEDYDSEGQVHPDPISTTATNGTHTNGTHLTDMSNSPFLNPGLRTTPNGLAIIQLSRDQFQPVYLHDAAGGEVDGYAEGAVLNTRFGSFPHSTMIGVPWGSQVRASVVDTGSRGRKRKRGGKQDNDKQDKTPAESGLESVAEKAATPTSDVPTPTASSAAAASAAASASALASAAASTAAAAPPPPQPPQAASGFVHILRPTPEVWTLSLPHRTQVVYTGDYSYILHRLRARPGCRIIEAGAGSGSFSHASARAVYGRQSSAAPPQPDDSKKNGHVYSFEFHNERYRTMQAELVGHGLSGDGENDLVTLTNRDVYADGFLLDNGTSPEADAVFLDLPAPWRALQHLTRSATADGKKSPLNPNKAVYLCSFSPCIEQVTRTVSMLRRLGWVDIDMVEVANKKILVYREKPELVSGKACTGEAGKTVPAPRDVGEAVARLKTIETRTREYNQKYWQQKDAEARGEDAAAAATKEEDVDMDEDTTPPPPLSVPSFMEGRLTSRVEPEVKTHTSYLVFAVLPRAWSEADEAAAAARWPVGNEQSTIGAVRRDIRKEQKRQEMRQKAKGKKNKEKE